MPWHCCIGSAPQDTDVVGSGHAPVLARGSGMGTGTPRLERGIRTSQPARVCHWKSETVGAVWVREIEVMTIPSTRLPVCRIMVRGSAGQALRHKCGLSVMADA